MMTHPTKVRKERTRGAPILLFICLFAIACTDSAPGPRGTWRTVSSPDGEIIRLDKPPTRLVSASAGITEMLLVLVGRDRIAAVPNHVFTGWATDCGAREDWPGRVLHRYRGEAVLGFKPDLVIAQTYQSRDTTRVLRESGVPVMCLPEVRSFEDLVRDIEIMGQVVGEDSKAASLVADLRVRMGALAADDRRKDVRILSYSDYGTGGWTAGADCSADLMIRLAGMKNAGADSGRSGHWQIDKEGLVDLDPDVILFGRDGSGRAPAADLLREDALLKRLRAVENGHVVFLPTALWNSTSHRLLDAAESLAKAVDDLTGG